MRRFVYIFVILTSMLACKSVSKMVEKGEYDKAFNYAIKKLTGEKNKKTEYVKALEKTYVKLNTATIKEIDRLNAPAKPENWPTVLKLYSSIEKRQNQLDPLLPLVSQDGYVASFEMLSFRNQIKDAEDKACDFYYNNAKTLIERSEKTGDKIAARNALDELKKIDSYKLNYLDSQRLKDKAYSLGITRISIDIYNNLRDFHSDNIERSLIDMPLAKLDQVWKDYMINMQGNKVDFIVELELKDIFFTPERERIHTYSETKEVLVSKEKVKEGKDSSTVVVEKQVFEKIKADITEIFREKQSELHGNIRIVNARNNKILKTVPVNVFFEFKGYSCNYNGNKKALTDETSKKLDSKLEAFPPDIVMADNLAEAFKSAVMSELKNFKFD